jgi:hypothetical protein
MNQTLSDTGLLPKAYLVSKGVDESRLTSTGYAKPSLFLQQNSHRLQNREWK